jgi:Holliday junction DNA helicase RuvB
LDYYSPEDLTKIIKRSASILNVDIIDDAALEISSRSRGTPRIVNRLLRRNRDFAQVKGNGVIDLQIARFALEALDVDNCGLDEMDKRILLTIIEKYQGGPVGLNALASSISEDAGTIEEVYEPFLIQQGFINRTPRGRTATLLAYKHFNISYPESSNKLFDV